MEKDICSSYVSDKKRCMGTKEIDPCNCEGDKSKCDFYSEVRKEKKKNITNRQWLESLSDVDLAMWLLDRYTVHLKLDDYDCNVKVGLQSLIKGYTDSYLGLFNWLTEVHKDNIS